MAGRPKSREAPWPRCQVLRRDGTPCGSAVLGGRDVCPFHAAHPNAAKTPRSVARYQREHENSAAEAA